MQCPGVVDQNTNYKKQQVGILNEMTKMWSKRVLRVVLLHLSSGRDYIPTIQEINEINVSL